MEKLSLHLHTISRGKTVESIMSQMDSLFEAFQQVRTDNSQEGRWVHSAYSTKTMHFIHYGGL